MTKKKLPKFVLPVVLLVLAICAYFLITGLSKKEDPSLTVSGTIEAVSSVVSPEVAGRVTQVLVDEGSQVAAGDTLFLLDDILLNAQMETSRQGLISAQKAADTARAALATAQANLDLALAAAMQESAAVRASDWQTQSVEGYTLPGGSFTAAEMIKAAEEEVEAAEQLQKTLSQAVLTLYEDPASAAFLNAEIDLLSNRSAVQTAKDVLAKASTSGNADLKDQAQTLYDQAVTTLEEAQAAYDAEAETEVGAEILARKTELVLADERLQAARMRLLALQTGENSLKVQTARAALVQAQAGLAQAEQAATQAQANLDLLQVQLSKLTVTAPIDGVVLTRSIEPGEVLSPASPALTLGVLDPLTITVYVPEAEIGLLALGQTARLSVDSFPGEVFSARIVHIADQAEFTPRNVQTTESRKTTVFAVKLQLENPEGRLKPGMPADVSFVQ